MENSGRLPDWVSEGMPDWNSGRLIDVVNHLAPGARLTATETFSSRVGNLAGVSILQACGAIVEAGYQDKDAELSADHATVLLYSGGLWHPWPAFTVEYEGAGNE
jgi:hypothetical protein